jgi:hypothetical protein
VPLLAIFGADDRLVPVKSSVRALRDSVRTDLLSVEVFAGADHPMRTGDGGSFADGCLLVLAAFVGTARAWQQPP